jgi:hypothetical protein
LKLRFTAEDVGASSVFNKIGGEFKRLQQRLNEGARINLSDAALDRLGKDSFRQTGRSFHEGGEEPGFFRSLKQQAEGIEGFSKLVRGLGAVAIAREIGDRMQRLPEIIDAYHEAMRQGATKTGAATEAVADAIPAVGELAKGFRAVGAVIRDEILSNRGNEARKREEQQDLRDIRVRQLEANEHKRLPIIRSGPTRC